MQVETQQATATQTLAPQTPQVAQPVQAQQINRAFLHDFLVRQDGKFVGLDFVKVDGEPRALNGRLGVRKFSHGGTNTVMALDRPYLTVFDAKAMGYRTVNLTTVSKVRANGSEFTVV